VSPSAGSRVRPDMDDVKRSRPIRPDRLGWRFDLGIEAEHAGTQSAPANPDVARCRRGSLGRTAGLAERPDESQDVEFRGYCSAEARVRV